MTPRFDDYEDRILSLPADPTASDVTSDDFLLTREGHLEVFCARLHGITPNARVVIVGLTPDKSQMVAAFREARRLLREGSRQLHSTSALRYPVLIEGSNYRGSPQIGRSPLLTEIVTINLPYELKQLPNALIVPLGKAVEGALALIGFGESPRLLKGFPHPSGANGHRTKQSKAEYQRLRSAVRAWYPPAAGA